MFPSLVRGDQTMFRSAGARKKFLEVALSTNISPLTGRRATMLCSEVAAARLFRCSLRSRVEKKLAHLAGHIAGDGTLLRPYQRLVDISAFQYPKSAHVLLGLGVRPVGDEHLAVGLGPQRLRAARRGNSASELPHAGSNHFAVECVDVLDHRFGYGGRVEVVGEVVSNQILRHYFFSCNGL